MTLVLVHAFKRRRLKYFDLRIRSIGKFQSSKADTIAGFHRHHHHYNHASTLVTVVHYLSKNPSQRYIDIEVEELVSARRVY